MTNKNSDDIKWQNFFNACKTIMEHPIGSTPPANSFFGNILSNKEYNMLARGLKRVYNNTPNYFPTEFDNLEIDTLIAVRNTEQEVWKLRKFNCVKQGEIYCYPGGLSSKQAETYQLIGWKYAKLLTPEFLEKCKVTVEE